MIMSKMYLMEFRNMLCPTIILDRNNLALEIKKNVLVYLFLLLTSVKEENLKINLLM